ncbi:MAG: hypothetical protein ACOYNI_05810 [Acidimicrobiia bacterium]
MESTNLTAMIDEALERFAGRGLISGDEIVDFLLDLRSAAAAEAFPTVADLGADAPVLTA